MTKSQIFNEKYNLKNVSNSAFSFVDISEIEDVDLVGKPSSNFKDFLKRFFTNKSAVISLVIFLAVLVMALVIRYTSPFSKDSPVVPKGSVAQEYIAWLPKKGTLVEKNADLTLINHFKHLGVSYKVVGSSFQGGSIISYDPWEVVEKSVPGFKAPNSVMGTESTGLDIWTRTWAGTLRSLVFAIIVVIITTSIGAFIGSILGLYVGTLLDIIVMKIMAVYSSVPSMVWYALITAMLPSGIFSLFMVFFITGWMSGLGTARMFMWKYVNSDFMRSAEVSGVSLIGRAMKHGLPNYIGIVFYGMVSSIPGVIEGEASLAFLGFSPDPDSASLGNVLNDIRQHSDQIAYVLLPTAIIFVITLSLHFVAMGVNDAVEPKFARR